MEILLTVQIVYTIFCVSFLLRFLPDETRKIKKYLYILTLSVVIVIILGVPIFIESFFEDFDLSFVFVYLLIGLVMLPSKIISDERSKRILSKMMYINYVLIYIPMGILHFNNSLAPDEVISRSVLYISFTILYMFLLHTLNKGKTNVFKIIVTLALVFGPIGYFLYQTFGGYSHDISYYESRVTNRIHVDDEFYIANDYAIELENQGYNVINFTLDKDFIYVLSVREEFETINNVLHDQYFVSIFSKDDASFITSHTISTSNLDLSYSLNNSELRFFEYEDIVYLSFEDGLYTVQQDGLYLISEVTKSESRFFYAEDECYMLLKKVRENYQIYKLKDGNLEYYETLNFTPENNKKNAIIEDDKLLIRDIENEMIIVYPDEVYPVSGTYKYLNIYAVESKTLLLGSQNNYTNSSIYGGDNQFDYYRVSISGNVEHISSNEFVNSDEKHINLGNTNLLYDVAGYKIRKENLEDKHYFFDYILKEEGLTRPTTRFYSEDNKLYSLNYSEHEDNEHNIYIEINEFKEVPQTYELDDIVIISSKSTLNVFIFASAMYGVGVEKVDKKKKEKGDEAPKVDVFDL